MKKFLKKALVSPWTALITLSILVYVIAQGPTFVESVRLRYFDQLVTSSPAVENNIYTVNIDEETINKYGQFPFKRTVYANLIADIYSRNAGLVVWDILMPEADRQGGDVALEDTLLDHNVILANTPSEQNKNVAKKPGSAVIGAEFLDTLVTYPGVTANIPSLEAAASGVGMTNTLEEIDGVNRRLPLFVASGGNLYPSMPLEVLRVMSNDDTFQVKLNENGVEKMRIPSFRPITTDSIGRIWVDWSQKSVPVSAVKLPKDFKKGIVIVGVTAAGLGNPVPTSLGPIWPQDMQAAVIGTLANNVNIERPDWAPGAELYALIGISIIILLLSRWTFVGLGVGIVLTASLIPGSMYVFREYKFLIDAIVPTAGVVLVMLHAYGVKFISEFLQKQAIKKQFAGYCSKEVVELLQKDPDLIKRGVRKDVSVMFSDLRGFTPIGEHYGDDVAGLGKYMNGYMDSISKPILDNKGMVIKYVGDASMHIHGAPIDDANHAHTIVKVGLEMLDAVDAYTKEMEAQGLPPAAMGWGCNTGIGFIGEMGSTERHSYDILGDMVSTAARLEARCKAYGVLCIIGAETYNRTKDDFFYLMLDNLQPKGKTVADLIYTALRTKGEDYSKDKVQHDKMHALYKAKKFDEAADMCKKMKGTFGGQMDKYYKIWIERCEFMKQQDLGPNWNGEFVAHEK